MSKSGGSKNGGQMIPVPDYFNEIDRLNNRRPNSYNNNQNNNNDTAIDQRLSERLGGSVSLDKDGLVVPRKPANPCVESMERRDLHRELMFHQKTGKSVLNQKTELQKALQKHRETQSRKTQEEERLSSRTALEITLAERARRLEELERFSAEERPKSGEPNEFLRMHAKLRGRVEPTSAMP